MVFNLSLKDKTPVKNEDRVIRIELIGNWKEREENFAKALANLLAATTISRHPAILPFMSNVMKHVGVALLGFVSGLDLEDQ